MELKVKKLNTQAQLPTRAHADDAGLDLYSVDSYELSPHQAVKVSTGIAVEIPEGCFGLVADRSSMGSKGVTCLGGVVDAGYRGEVHVILINLTNTPISIQSGNKIAQLLILPVPQIKIVEAFELNETQRQGRGFGSTGA